MKRIEFNRCAICRNITNILWDISCALDSILYRAVFEICHFAEVNNTIYKLKHCFIPVYTNTMLVFSLVFFFLISEEGIMVARKCWPNIFAEITFYICSRLISKSRSMTCSVEQRKAVINNNEW